LFRYQAGELLGKSIEILMPERMRELHRHGLARFNRTGHGGYVESHAPIELPALHSDGQELAIELTLSAMGEVPIPGRYVVAILRDITARTKREEDLRQSHTRLQAELQRRDTT